MLLLIFARRVLLLEGWQQEMRPGTFAFAERIQYILIHYTSHTSLGWARVVTGPDGTKLTLSSSVHSHIAVIFMQNRHLPQP